MLSLVRRGPAALSSDGSAQRQQLVFPKAILFQQIPRKGSKPTQALEGGQGRGREGEMVRQTSPWVPDTPNCCHCKDADI